MKSLTLTASWAAFLLKLELRWIDAGGKRCPGAASERTEGKLGRASGQGIEGTVEP